MTIQEMINELEFERDPENAKAQLVVDAANFDSKDWRSKFYPDLR